MFYKKQLVEAFFRGVYHILIKEAGAGTNISIIMKDDNVVFVDHDEENFIHHHAVEHKDRCREWRFSGNLGFGGKYRSQTNKVDYYPEDTSPEREQIIMTTNQLLLEWKRKFDKFVEDKF